MQISIQIWILSGIFVKLCSSLHILVSNLELYVAFIVSGFDLDKDFRVLLCVADFPILPYLTDWIRVNFDLTSDILPKLIEQGTELDIETSELLWTLIYSHVFHGMI